MHRFRQLLGAMWREDDGVLTFEWVLLSSVLTFGVVSGVAGARDAIIDELGDVAQAMLALDQSYRIDNPLRVDAQSPSRSASSDSQFVDAALFGDETRALVEDSEGQGNETDADQPLDEA